MNRKTLFFFLILICIFQSQICNSQVQIVENPSVKAYSSDQKSVYELWNNYLASWNTEDSGRCEMWASSEPCDLLATGFFNPSLYKLNFTVQTLSIVPVDQNAFEITALFYWVDNNRNLNTMAITNVLVKRQQDGQFKLSNYLIHSTEDWKQAKVGAINYHYPVDYSFDPNKAVEANHFVNQLEKEFDLENEPIDYYLFKNCYDETRMRGFYYLPNLGLNKDCGYFDVDHNIIYTTQTLGEAHLHELVHLINKKYPNAHWLLLTGLAVYQPGEEATLGYSFQELFKNELAYINKNQIRQLDPLDFPTFDPKVTDSYLSGPILIDLILNKGGKPLLIQALENIHSDEDLKAFIKTDLKLSPDEYSKVALQKIREMAQNQFKMKLYQ